MRWSISCASLDTFLHQFFPLRPERRFAHFSVAIWFRRVARFGCRAVVRTRSTMYVKCHTKCSHTQSYQLIVSLFRWESRLRIHWYTPCAWSHAAKGFSIHPNFRNQCQGFRFALLQNMDCGECKIQCVSFYPCPVQAKENLVSVAAFRDSLIAPHAHCPSVCLVSPTKWLYAYGEQHMHRKDARISVHLSICTVSRRS